MSTAKKRFSLYGTKHLGRAPASTTMDKEAVKVWEAKLSALKRKMASFDSPGNSRIKYRS